MLEEEPSIEQLRGMLRLKKLEVGTAGGEAYNIVMAWLEPNGYRIAGPVREVYLRGPGDTRNPEEYVTEIPVPVEKA